MNLDNPFYNIQESDSADIYRQFILGKIIVKQTYNENTNKLEECPLYTILFNNLNYFKRFYRHLGFVLEFHDEGEFFYITEQLNDVNGANENAFKVQVILLLIGEYFSSSGRDLELLCEINAGLDEHDITMLSSNSKYIEILRTLNVKGGGWKEALDYLIKRNFAFRTSVNSIFLSSVGKAFIFHLVQEYAQKNNENM